MEEFEIGDIIEIHEDSSSYEATVIAVNERCILIEGKNGVEILPIYEAYMTKHVSSEGAVKRKKSRSLRKKHAVQTTGMSKGELKRRAIKAAKTRKKDPAKQKKAEIKKKKALRKRKALGL